MADCRRSSRCDRGCGNRGPCPGDNNARLCGPCRSRDLNPLCTTLVLGTDDNLPTNPVITGAAAVPLMEEALGFTRDQLLAMRADAVSWFNRRFGIDFTNAPVDPASLISVIANAVLVPLYFTASDTYRVLSSTTPVIKTSGCCRPPVRLSEWVVTFFSPPTYGGAYAANAPGGTIPGQAGDNLAFGTYRIDAQGRTHYVDMKSYYPAHSQPFQAGWSPSTERFLLRSSDFGVGWGTLDIFAPSNTEPPFPWHIRNTWNFPGSPVIPMLDVWDQ